MNNRIIAQQVIEIKRTQTIYGDHTEEQTEQRNITYTPDNIKKGIYKCVDHICCAIVLFVCCIILF